MAVQGLTVTLTTDPTLIAGSNSASTPTFGMHGTLRVLIRNRGAATVYLGGASVTTAGYPLTTADVPDALVLQPWDTLYGTSTGSIAVNVLRFNETT